MPIKKPTKTSPSKVMSKAPIDKSVSKPRGIRVPDPDSILSQLLKLDVGATWARAERLPASSTVHQDIIDSKARQRMSMTTQTSRANKAHGEKGARFSLAIGDFRADDGDVMVVATVTRIS